MGDKENPIKGHKLELLGIGASQDRQLKANLLEALWQIGLDIPVQEVREIDRLIESGVSGIPALVVDGRVIFQKVVPTVEDLRLVLRILLNDEKRRMPVRNIIVPTDFSETAENAYRYALDLAAFLGANVRLVHIYQSKSDLSGAVLLDGATEEFYIKQELLESLSQSGRFSALDNNRPTGSEVQPEMIRGFVVDELRNLSKRKDTDLIVMGTTGDSKFLGRWLGSISTEVARKAYCPVILVPRSCHFEPYKDVVYACDYHQNEENVLGKMLDFSAHFMPLIHLVHVNTAKNAPSEGFQQLPIGEAEKGKGLNLKLSRVSNPDILEALIEYARNNEAGLITMGTAHRPFFEDLFHRRLTREMAFNTTLPLMVIHFDD